MWRKLQNFMNSLSPLLYMVSKFILITVAVGLFIGDFIIAAGIVAAIGLYYILDAQQRQENEEMYYRMLAKAGIEERKRNG